MMIMPNNKQNGAASFFIMIFTTLIIVVVTVSFIRIMISSQQQATANDLSQSAYDSAQAGVEDAKRAILRYQSICANANTTIADCSAAHGCLVDPANPANPGCNANPANPGCNATSSLTDVQAAQDVNSGDVKVQTTTTNDLNQVYSCVKIKLDTADYVGDLKQDASNLIPLVGVSNFDTIKIEWFGIADVQGDLQSLSNIVNVPSSANGVSLLAQNTWTSATSPNRPSIMRAQIMQFATAGFTLTDFDNNNASAASSTMFLYPSTISSIPASGFPATRRQAVFSPVQTLCSPDLSVNIYSCSATIKLPISPVGGGARTAFLNLKALYKKTSYRITLQNGSTPVDFNEVQPEVDSTGRANNIFRRVSARVGLGDISFPYPEAEVDTTGNFCKNFMVTNNTGDYGNSCTP